ncbi:MAG: HAD family phosphatase [Planctomycetes bacterium]|nr:HAD family phosphatase [Planctomycetota bacterium]
MPIRAFLFDMDGLLIDTEDLHMRAFAETATGLGFPSKPHDFTCWIGHSAAKMSQWLVERCTVKTTPEEIIRIEQEAFLRILEDERPEPLPGAKEMLDAADQLKAPRGLVSSTIYPQVERTMKVVLAHLKRGGGLDAHFGAVVTGDRVKNIKPAPDPYLQAAEGLGVAPGECLVFEDSPAGVASARAAGCKVCAIPNMYLDTKEIVAKAHAHFPTLLEAHAARVWENV